VLFSLRTVQCFSTSLFKQDCVNVFCLADKVCRVWKVLRHFTFRFWNIWWYLLQTKFVEFGKCYGISHFAFGTFGDIFCRQSLYSLESVTAFHISLLEHLVISFADKVCRVWKVLRHFAFRFWNIWWYLLCQSVWRSYFLFHRYKNI
jgi:hypothetical protein